MKEKKQSRRRTVLTVLCILLAVITGCSLVACDFSFSSGGNLNGNSQKASSYVVVNTVAPVEFVLDQNNVVLSAAGINDDGCVLLWKEDGIIGADIRIAIKRIISLAIKYGYLTEKNNCVGVYTASTVENENLLQNVCKAVDTDELDLTVRTDLNYVLSKELEDVKTANPDDEEIQNLDVGIYRLLKRATDCGGITLQEAMSLEIGKLLDMIRTNQADTAKKLGSVYQSALKEASFNYDIQKQSLYDNLYVQYLIEKAQSAQGYKQMLREIDRAVNAVKYQAFRSIRMVADNYLSTITADEYNVSSANLLAVHNILLPHISDSLDTLFLSILQKGDIISIDDIYFFIDNAYVNAQNKSAFDNAYATVKSQALKKENTSDNSHNDISQSISNILADSIPDELRGFIDKDALKTSLPSFDFDSTESVKAALVLVDEQIALAYSGMQLTVNDLNGVNEMLNRIENSLNSIKDELNTATNSAKIRAEEFLNGKKTA